MKYIEYIFWIICGGYCIKMIYSVVKNGRNLGCFKKEIHPKDRPSKTEKHPKQ